MFNKGSLRSKKLIKKKRRKFLVKFSLFLFTIILIFLGLVFLSRADFLKIEKVEILGNKKISSETLNLFISKEMSGNYLFFFPKDNSITYPQDSLKKKILRDFIDIKQLEIKRDGLKKIVLNIKERENFATWCLLYEIEGETQLSNDCFFIDKESFAFSEAFDFNSAGFFKFFSLFEGSPIGNTFIDTSTFSKINIFIEDLKDLNLEPAFFLKDKTGDFEIYFQDGEKIIFKEGDDFGVLFENLSNVFLDPDLKFIDEEGNLAFWYIDLRFGNKVFYSVK